MTDTKLQTLADAVRPCFKGARLAKFDASIEVLQASLAQGGWTPRGSVKAQSGFYQGITRSHYKGYENPHSALHSCLHWGSEFRGAPPSDVDCAVHGTKLSPDAIRAWVALCNYVTEVHYELDASRPVPVITDIGLSPKVTATLRECNLDVDLPSIKLAKIDFRWVRAYEDGKPAFRKDGKPRMEKCYFVEWSQGIKHGCSRFADGGHCEACGKRIPSQRYVPIEATCKKQGLISMWIGCDCAKNIFGIKDAGIDKNATPESVSSHPR